MRRVLCMMALVVNNTHDHRLHLSLNDNNPSTFYLPNTPPLLLSCKLSSHQRNALQQYTTMHPFRTCLPTVCVPQVQQKLVTSRKERK